MAAYELLDIEREIPRITPAAELMTLIAAASERGGQIANCWGRTLAIAAKKAKLEQSGANERSADSHTDAAKKMVSDPWGSAVCLCSAKTNHGGNSRTLQ